jgi:hypothetical protein
MSGVSLAPELVEPIEIPAVLPVLPVRDVAVFPAMIVPLFVSREITLSAIGLRGAGGGAGFWRDEEAATERSLSDLPSGPDLACPGYLPVRPSRPSER